MGISEMSYESGMEIIFDFICPPKLNKHTHTKLHWIYLDLIQTKPK